MSKFDFVAHPVQASAAVNIRHLGETAEAGLIFGVGVEVQFNQETPLLNNLRSIGPLGWKEGEQATVEHYQTTRSVVDAYNKAVPSALALNTRFSYLFVDMVPVLSSSGRVGFTLKLRATASILGQDGSPGLATYDIKIHLSKPNAKKGAKGVIYSQGGVLQERVFDGNGGYRDRVHGAVNQDNVVQMLSPATSRWAPYRSSQADKAMEEGWLHYRRGILSDTRLDTTSIPVSAAERGDHVIVYRVQQGDTLSEIAEFFNIGLEKLAHINQIGNPNIILPNQVLVISPNLHRDGDYLVMSEAYSLNPRRS